METKSVAIKALIQASMFGLVALLVLLLINAAQVLLLVFAGLLFSVVLRGMTNWIAEKTRLPDGISLALAILGPLTVIGLGAWMIAPEVAAQATQLADRLPQAINELKRQALQYSWVQELWDRKEALVDALPGDTSSAGVLTRFFTTTFGVLGNLVIVFFLGLFLAITPNLYLNGVVRLFPTEQRARAKSVLQSTGMTLRSWMVAKLTTMAVIGVLTTIGLWFLNIDLALVLGVIAALLSFIPNFGPVASAIPAMLIALVAGGPQKALYVALLYIAIQTAESYVLTPMLQKHMVDLPPALILTMQILLGVLAGVLGVILSVPLTAAAMVMVKMWYVEDMLEGQRHQAGVPA